MSTPVGSARDQAPPSAAPGRHDVLARVGFTTAIAIAVGVSVLSIATMSDFGEEARWVGHTYEVMSDLNELQMSVVTAQTGARGYAITRQSRFLAPYHDGVRRVDAQMQRLDVLMKDDPEQLMRLAQLRPQIAAQLQNLAEVVTLTDQGSQPEAQRLIASGRGETAMDGIRRRIREMLDAEEALLHLRTAAVQRGAAIAKGLVVVGAIASLGLLVVAYLALRRENARRALSEARATDANAFLDLMFEAVPHILYVKSVPDLCYLRINKAHEYMFGIPRGQLLGKNDAELFAPAQVAQIRAEDRATLEGIGVFEVEVDQLVSPGRGVRTLHKKKVVIPDAQGQPMYLLGIAEDITEHKRAQREIARLNETLERRARELEIANKELDSFTYSVSHDLRAPLRAINGFALMLAEDHAGHLDDEGTRLLGVVRTNAQRMGVLIDDLLAFSRIGRAAMNRVNVDMEALVAAVLREVDEPADTVMPPCRVGPLPAAVGDPALLKQVWSNLISNAVKYSSRNRAARIEVSGERIDGGCVYRVADNGAGFDMRYAEKLFGVFQRLHRAEEFPGTGVGLAIVQRIVVRHGGRVWAEGRINEGATFHFALPLEESATSSRPASSA